jgi:polar amino acid transport system substrate-binding protein
MLRLAAATALLIAALFAAPERADAQEACDYYRVQRGDSLREIAERVYGDKNYRRIWNANRSEIGRDPNVISVGTVLRLPCRKGQKPRTEATANTTAPGTAEVALVTANGYLPYTDESLAHRGLFTHLVTNALVRAAPERRFEIVFVNDWAAHLDTLLPRQAFDASFPWTRPNCETQGALTDAELYACRTYLYSDPFYEIVDGFFARTGSGYEDVADFAALKGAAICRPEGYPTGHLEEAGLMTGEVTLLQPLGASRCFELLMSGKADLVALDTRTGERATRDLGLLNQVSENRYLFAIQELRVVLHKDNPKSAALLADLNRGLRIMLESGEWTAIVSDGLKEQADALTN